MHNPKFDDSDLVFTKEDRVDTIQKIREQKLIKKQQRHTKLGPVAASIVAIILSIGIFMPMVMSGNHQSTMNDTEAGNKQPAAIQESETFPILLMVTNESSRTELNLLITYNEKEQSMKQVIIPRDLYTDMEDENSEFITKDKLTHAYSYSGDPSSVVNIVSNLLDIRIPYYAVVPNQEFLQTIGAKEGQMDYDQLLEKLNGNLDFIALDELVQKTGDSSDDYRLPDNLSSEYQVTSSALIDMGELAEEKMVEGIYYVEIDDQKLSNISQLLKEHLSIN